MIRSEGAGATATKSATASAEASARESATGEPASASSLPEATTGIQQDRPQQGMAKAGVIGEDSTASIRVVSELILSLIHI